MKSTQLFKDFLQEVEYLTNKDVDATSEEHFCGCPGGKARPASNYIAEAGLFQTVIAERLANPTGEIDMQSRYGVLENIQTKEQSRELFTQGCRDLEAALDKVDTSELNDEIQAPWGMPTTKGKLILHGLAHTMYHLGQLNQTQLIHGDDQMHWME